MASPQVAAQYFGPIASTDESLRLFDLSQWFAAGASPAGTPSAGVVPIDNDPTPLAIDGAAAWDLGARNVFVAPFGLLWLSPGPRVAITLVGGTKGNTYTILLTWQDSTGQQRTRPAYQFVQWGPTG